MCQSNYLEISRAALRRNAQVVIEAVHTPVIAVVKCGGYGVTIPEAAEAWRHAGASMFAVSRPEEALELRACGADEEILLLSPVADERTLDGMLKSDVTLTADGIENAYFYCRHAKGIRAHVAVDTGMGRFGVPWSDIGQIRDIYSLMGTDVRGIFSHFSRSYESRYKLTKKQLGRFLAVTETLAAEGVDVGMRHIANSCAALRFPQTRLDAVRIGSALVGRTAAATPAMLEPVSVFNAQVVACRSFYIGDTTGYGSRYRFRRHTRAAIVAVGREDGFGTAPMPDKLRIRDLAAYLYHTIRRWCDSECVLYNGHRLPMIGRIGNQFTLFDASDVDISPGDWVQWEGSLMLSSCKRRFV